MRLPARSPLVHGTAAYLSRADNAGGVVCEMAGEWCLDTVPWSTQCEKGVSIAVPLHPAPAWATLGASFGPALLADDVAVGDGLVHAGAGVCDGAQATVKRIVASLPATLVLRARSLLRQQYVSVDMPTPSLDGGIGSDQLVAYPGDWDAYRLLVLLARLVPGALTPVMVPRFTVKSAILLRLLERWMLPPVRTQSTAHASTKMGSGDGGGAAPAAAATPETGISTADAVHTLAGGSTSSAEMPSNPWQQDVRWSEAGPRIKASLMEHQRDAVERMLHPYIFSLCMCLLVCWSLGDNVSLAFSGIHAWTTRVDQLPVSGAQLLTLALAVHAITPPKATRAVAPPGHMVVMDTGLGRYLFAVGLHFSALSIKFRDRLLCDRLLCDRLLCDRLLCDRLLCDHLLCDRLLCDRLLCDRLLCDRLLCDRLLCDRPTV